MDNLDYLFWAHSFFWVLIFGYIFNISMKNKRLSNELEALRSNSEEESGN